MKDWISRFGTTLRDHLAVFLILVSIVLGGVALHYKTLADHDREAARLTSLPGSSFSAAAQRAESRYSRDHQVEVIMLVLMAGALCGAAWQLGRPIRRWVAERAMSVSGPRATQSQETLQSLQSLQIAHGQGLLSDEEYEQRRKTLLDHL